MNADTQLRERCREALSLTAKHGADEVEVFGQTVHVIAAEVEKHDLQTSSSQQETMIGIRALVNKQLGFACSNVLADLEATCVDAVSLAKASPIDENNVLPEPIPFDPMPELHDPQAEEFTVADAVEMSIGMIETADSIDSRLILGNGAFAANLQTRCLVNSNGVDAVSKRSLFTYYALATAKDGNQVSNMAFGFDATHCVQGIDSARVARRACMDALGSLGAGKGESFVGSVILSPSAVQALLLNLLAFQLSAKSALRGASRWGSMLSESVAHPSLTITDDGRLPGGVATAPFDREGMPHREITLIDSGKISALIHNAYSASSMGTTSTAHAAGSARSLPGIGPTNLTVRPGDVSKDELIQDTKIGLLVNRFSGSANPISGDFSGVAKSASLIKNGKVIRPVTGTLIAGNLFEALQNLSGISEETERVFAATLPSLRFEGVSVTAK